MGGGTPGFPEGAGRGRRAIPEMVDGVPADAAGENPFEGASGDEGSVRGRQKADERRGDGENRVRDGLRTRGRADFPLHL